MSQACSAPVPAEGGSDRIRRFKSCTTWALGLNSSFSLGFGSPTLQMKKVLADSIQLSYSDWGGSQWLARRGLGKGQSHRHDIARASTPHTAILQPRKSPSPLGHIFFYGHCWVLFILLHFCCYSRRWRISNAVNSLLRVPAFQIHRQPAWR